MKLLNLALYFSLDLDFAFEEFTQSAHNVIATLLDLIDFFALDFPEKLGRNLLFRLWNDEVDKSIKNDLICLL